MTRKGNLTRTILARHFRGEDQGHLIGLHTTSAENTCRWVLLDIDHHGESDPDRHQANRKAVIKFCKKLRNLGFTPLLTSSNGIGGYHILVIFANPVPTPTAYAFARWLIRDWKGTGIPKRPGNLPQTIEARRQNPLRQLGASPGTAPYPGLVFKLWVDGHWASGEEAIEAILATGGSAHDLIPEEAPGRQGRRPGACDKCVPKAAVGPAGEQ